MLRAHFEGSRLRPGVAVRLHFLHVASASVILMTERPRSLENAVPDGMVAEIDGGHPLAEVW